MSSEIEPSQDKAFWSAHRAGLDLALSFLPKPVEATAKYAIERWLRVVAVAADESQTDPATLLGAVGDREAYADLVQHALAYAVRTRAEQKHRAFGRAIVRGYLATDDAEIDSERFVARTIDALELPRLAAIEIIAANPTERVGAALAAHMKPDEVAQIITRQLANEGLLANEVGTVDGGTVFHGLSAYGERVRAHLVTVGRDGLDRE